MIEFADVSYSYNRKTIFNNLSLKINAGQFIGVLGRNGTGKSTLARLMNGLLIPTTGRVMIEGMDTQDHRVRQKIRSRVGVMFSNPDTQLLASAVEEDVAFGPQQMGLDWWEIEERVSDALKRVGLASYRKRKVDTLSGGEKQLVVLAGLLAMNGRYIVLDEPTAYLDKYNAKKVMEIVDDLHEQGIAVIMTTHSPGEVIKADEIVILDREGISIAGKPSDVITDEASLTALGIRPPITTALAARLSARGISLSAKARSSEEMVEELCRLR